MYLNFNQFLKYKIHIGHSSKTIKYLSSWLLYKLYNNIWIVDIFKTILFLKNIVVFIKYLISNNFPIWFINLELTKEFLFLNNSKICGEFACTRYWVRGMLSNYLSVTKSIKKYASKKYVYKSSIFLKIVNNWYITRYTWPRAIFISNLDSNYIVCKEAALMRLPVIGIIDSNVRSYLVKLPIISNDDSMESFYYIFSLIVKLILLLKYKKLILWFSNYKQKIKMINLKKLINNSLILQKKKNNYFKPISVSNTLNKNLNIIYYRTSSNLFFNKKSLIYFDLKLLKKKYFFRKFTYVSFYKFILIFKNKLNMHISKFSNNILRTLKRKKKARFIIRHFYNMKKYSSFYFTSFIYALKYSRIFYNTFLFKKINKSIFLDLAFLRKNRKNKLSNFKYSFFPFFFFKKKRRIFLKNRKKKYSFHTDYIQHKFLLNYYNNRIVNPLYIKIFIELYYNKWFICLLNSN
jgi:small subunit ribosomal protein S2